MKFLTTRSSKAYSASHARIAVALIIGTLLTAVLAGCQASSPNGYEQSVPHAFASNNFGVSEAEASTSYDGLSKQIRFDFTFTEDELTTDQLVKTVTLLEQNLGSRMESTSVSVLFLAPDGNLMASIDDAVNGMNSALGLSGADAISGEGSILFFPSVDQLRDLADQLERIEQS